MKCLNVGLYQNKLSAAAAALQWHVQQGGSLGDDLAYQNWKRLARSWLNLMKAGGQAVYSRPHSLYLQLNDVEFESLVDQLCLESVLYKGREDFWQHYGSFTAERDALRLFLIDKVRGDVNRLVYLDQKLDQMR